MDTPMDPFMRMAIDLETAQKQRFEKAELDNKYFFFQQPGELEVLQQIADYKETSANLTGSRPRRRRRPVYADYEG